MMVATQRRAVPAKGVPPKRRRPFLGWSGYFLCLVGILLLSYCGYVLLETRLYQAYQSWRFENALGNELPPPPALPATPGTALVLAESRAVNPAAGVPLGRIEISRIGFAAMVMEGVDSKTLRHAVGHIPGTALPGQPGNVAIAGHRDTFFRRLRDLRKEDEITLTTLDGAYRYRVDFTLVVEPREIWVLEDTGDTILTLVTCYPFHYVGPAPQRFIVRARRVAVDAPSVPSEKWRGLKAAPTPKNFSARVP